MNRTSCALLDALGFSALVMPCLVLYFSCPCFFLSYFLLLFYHYSCLTFSSCFTHTDSRTGCGTPDTLRTFTVSIIWSVVFPLQIGLIIAGSVAIY